MNELVFVQVGMTKADTLMKYEPEQSCIAFDEKARGFVKLYLLKDSALNSFARLVLTEGIGDGFNLVWERFGTSARYVKYRAIENEHMPAKWGWNERAINTLYILKNHPLNTKAPNNDDALYFSANYGGAVKPSLHVITEMPKGEGKTLDIDAPLPHLVRKSNKELRIRKILLEATKLAKLADAAQTKVVEARKPTSLVDSFTGNYAGSIQDDCGSAWIAGVDGRSQLGRIWKKLGQNSQSGFFYGDNRHCGIHVSDTQYVSIRKAAAEAFAAHVNAELGTELYVWTQLD